jgi:hypothetical protein
VTDSERLERIARVLEEIRDGQRKALALQREHAQKTQALQARAEALQDRSAAPDRARPEVRALRDADRGHPDHLRLVAALPVRPLVRGRC